MEQELHKISPSPVRKVEPDFKSKATVFEDELN
jgi:hypothetical protein